ncbi:hypothetical protein [Longirhabdus pacifica]|uniref:hypothetical protein n=1 Tax=Longirhabdus pacifica TaxID=2305227 RepID=UPI0010093529|nr:hypothetical protein [Longirhabdus pacifica]
MLTYEYNTEDLTIEEKKNGNDHEFTILIIKEELCEKLLEVRYFFENNDIHTDVLFYTHNKENEYHIIVRNDMYVSFLLLLFQHQLIQSLKW